MTEKIDTDKLPTAVREQDLPVGGAVDGALPRVGIPTVPTGIGLTREAPSLRGNATAWTQPQNAAGVEPYRIGAEPLRRRILLSVAPDASATAYVVAATTREQAQAGQGLVLSPGQNPVALQYADMLWIASIGAALTVSFLAELDQG